ncbi:helix-turn-helix domain-containing protein [Spirochaeta cellobiosiphila]|uniref:helix-turn-helix domain-containing protein n=1 Tax=Spirochaeta cellobiosiphila TaxID=504483 RepID=UPI0003FF5DC4|nr:helix-turn-helix transcriptional regulator [Spirochaeta cellobiosiphila]
MATKLGQAFRDLRLTKGVTMGKMAEALNVTPPFLSAIEHGKKKPSDELIEKVIQYFELNEEKAHSIKDLVAKEIGEKKISLDGLLETDKDDILAFARKYTGLGEDAKNMIRKMLDEN